MKYGIAYALLLAPASLSAQVTWKPLTQSAPAVNEVPPPTTPQPMEAPQPTENRPQFGKIVMYRGGSVWGAGLACPIRYKGREIVELARGKFAEWSVPSGRYILTNHTASVEVSVDPGETRYVRCMIKSGFLTGRADLQIVDAESFNEHRNQYEEKPVAPLK